MGYWKFDRLATGTKQIAKARKLKKRRLVKVGKSPSSGKMIIAVYKKK